jgi:hypothetical protein
MTYADFKSYAHDYPEAEPYRRWLTRTAQNKLLIFPGKGMHAGLPGGFLWATSFNNRIFVHDNDDGCCIKEFSNQESAYYFLNEIGLISPIDMQQLVDGFDFKWNS